MRAGHLVYRCRRCQALDLVPFENIEQGVEDNLESSRGIGAHDCADGAIGVTDLIGAIAGDEEFHELVTKGDG